MIIGITQETSTKKYYLVFYHKVPIRLILDRIIKRYKGVQYIQYSDFDQLKEIGCGGYGTVYTAKYKDQIMLLLIYQKLWHSNGSGVLIKCRNYLFLR